MCGRMNISDHEGIHEFLIDLKLPLDWLSPPEVKQKDFAAGFNVAPGSFLKAIYAVENKFHSTVMQWGITPSWTATKENKLPNKLMYARAETVWQKKSFANLIEKQRVVIPINGFYEWHRESNVRQPFYFSPRKTGVCFLAGLFSIVENNKLQCCVLTNVAGDLMASIHHRSPVIIDPESLHEWLFESDFEKLTKIMDNTNESLLRTFEVSSYVNNTRNGGESCIIPLKTREEPIQKKLF
ncbi:hypothetical protein MNBD_GAMMA12-1913 [hydrothermal vent metagenome]|uniref:Abasic site processing protein n=1 Tax=hydrothermal vent metagenome TaxID=652676 RepID=A0A3B0Z3R5_9ZZZZ